MAGDIGFEPILTESESAVLPLDESPFSRGNFNNLLQARQEKSTNR